MRKQNGVYAHNGILFVQKKEGNTDICCSMDEAIMLSKRSQTQRTTYVIMFMWNVQNR